MPFIKPDMVNQIKIIVAGVGGEGNSTIASLIQEALEANGISCYLTPDEIPKKWDEKFQAHAIKFLGESTIVNVVTKTVKK